MRVGSAHCGLRAVTAGSAKAKFCSSCVLSPPRQLASNPYFSFRGAAGTDTDYPRWQEVSDVTYLLALIAVVAVAMLCWKAFEYSDRPAPAQHRHHATA